MSDRDAPALSSDESESGPTGTDPLLELLEEGVCRLDADGAFVSVNDAFLDPLGYDREDLLGERLSTLVVAEDRPRLSAVLRWYDSPDGPDGVRFDAVQVRFETADGRRLHRQLRLDAAKSSSPGHTVAVLRDSTEGDESVGPTPDVSALIDDMPGMVYRSHDPEEPPMFVSDGCADVTGYDAAMLESGAVRWRSDVVHPADRDRVREEVHIGLAQRGRFAVEYRVRTADRRTRWVRERGRTVLGPDGEPMAIDSLLHDVTERRRTERAVDESNRTSSERARLEAVVRDIHTAVVQQSTREEVEQAVCQRLAASDAYEFAWVGAADVRRNRVEVHTEAGVEGYFEESVDGDVEIALDDGENDSPTERAIRTGETQIHRDIRADPDGEQLHARASEYGFRSCASVPIDHDGTLYGVLNVHSAREDAFGRGEREVIGQLGGTIGHAIAALERKRALMNDEVIEVEFQLRNLLDILDVPEGDGTVRFERALPLGDGEYIEYGTATPDMVETLLAMGDGVEYIDDVTVGTESDDRVRFEMRVTEPPLRSIMAARGIRIVESVIESGDYYVTVHLSPGSEVRRVVETVEEAYPDIEFVSQQQVEKPNRSPKRFRQSVFEELTQRQRTVIESAYYAGFFEWPREATGEEVAASLDIAASTFHQHLRKAEGTVLRKLLREAVAPDQGPNPDRR